ncbi:MAG: TIGR03960 family B12-binding radical SAM protein [Candidatus Eisenbacteria bacterium]|nr:TIGR03960 family B12-binding radical SAM protein [Candidatus Eisenbacteria bacterium]
MKNYSTTLEELILPLVRKPGRYVGEFVTGCRDMPAGKELKVALVFPDTCEVGVANLGLRILGAALKEVGGVLLDYCFAPWPDFEAQLRGRCIPLLSLCHSLPMKDFDVVGFSLQYELQCANVLNMLDLAGIPLLASERDESHPLVVAGGSCALNPEPLSDFIDCFSIGDGEETIGQICSIVKAHKKRRDSRAEVLEELSKCRGLYVPSLFSIRSAEDGMSTRCTSGRSVVRSAVTKSIERHEPIIFTPRVQVTHDRLNVEVMRGCTHGCRFCMAGYTYRPVREKNVNSVLGEAIKGFANAGLEEISLVSLSTPDYSGLPELLPLLDDAFAERGVDVTLPSMRPDTLTFELAKDLDRFKKSGMTLAPEAGTRRLRDVINKGMDDEEIVTAITVASEFGWNLIKLYFMIGLPTETEEDIRAIPRLIEKALGAARKVNPRASFNVSISPFIPKAHTPFQWERQDSLEEMASKTRAIVDPLRRLPIKVRWRDPGVSFLEGIIARGDRRIGEAILLAWKKGARLDAWSDFFRFNLWQEALDESGLSTESYTGARSTDRPLPWDHVEVVSREFLLRERTAAYEGRLTEDCRRGACHSCGVLEGTGLTPEATCFVSTKENKAERKAGTPVPHSVELSAGAEALTGGKYRLQYEKTGKARFLSHLDLVRIFTRALRASKLPVAYSSGYRARPRVSFGPPLPLGFVSRSEYFDLELETAPQEDPGAALNPFLPEGIRFLEWKRLAPGERSLSSVCTLARYDIGFPEHFVAPTGMSLEEISNLLSGAKDYLAKKGKVTLERGADSKRREIELAGAVKEIELSHGKRPVLQMLLSIQGTDVVRPDEVVGILLEDLGDDKIEKRYLSIERTGLYVSSSKGIQTPM